MHAAGAESVRQRKLRPHGELNGLGRVPAEGGTRCASVLAGQSVSIHLFREDFRARSSTAETRWTQRGKAATQGAPTFLSALALARDSGRQECRRSCATPENPRGARGFVQIAVQRKAGGRKPLRTSRLCGFPSPAHGLRLPRAASLRLCVDTATAESRLRTPGYAALRSKSAHGNQRDRFVPLMARDAVGLGIEHRLAVNQELVLVIAMMQLDLC